MTTTNTINIKSIDLDNPRNEEEAILALNTILNGFYAQRVRISSIEGDAPVLTPSDLLSQIVTQVKPNHPYPMTNDYIGPHYVQFPQETLDKLEEKGLLKAMMTTIVAQVERMTPEEYNSYIATLKASYEAKLEAHGIQPEPITEE